MALSMDVNVLFPSPNFTSQAYFFIFGFFMKNSSKNLLSLI